MLEGRIYVQSLTIIDLLINFAEFCPEECHVEVELDCDGFSPDPNAPRPFDINPMCEPFMRAALGLPPLEECQCRDGYLRDGEELLAAKYIQYRTNMCIKLSGLDDCHNGCVDTEGNKIRV